jgi:hypothetical protein
VVAAADNRGRRQTRVTKTTKKSNNRRKTADHGESDHDGEWQRRSETGSCPVCDTFLRSTVQYVALYEFLCGVENRCSCYSVLLIHFTLLQIQMGKKQQQHKQKLAIYHHIGGRGGIDKNLRKNISSNIDLKNGSCRYVHAE